MSLHKNLLVANVLQRARTAFMENFHLVNINNDPQHDDGDSNSSLLLGYTVEEPDQDDNNTCYGNINNNNKENDYHHPFQEEEVEDDGDLEEEGSCCPSRGVLRLANPYSSLSSPRCLKRRCHSEVEEAVNSILPKRPRHADQNEEEDDDEDDNNCVVTELCSSSSSSYYETENAMDVEQISSLVTIFSSSFTGLVSGGKTNDSSAASSANNNNTSALSRSMSTPDLCSKEVKDSLDVINMPVLAMTV